MSEQIQFAKVTPQEEERIKAILDRASGMFPVYFDRLSLWMDLKACHADVPLDFGALLESDDFTFAHDVGGIINHMDRETGKLGGCFVPRTAASPVTQEGA